MDNKQQTKPDKPCWNCKQNKWWQRKDGEWICGVCHPNPKDEIYNKKP